jgi:predicted TIM-barrel fold metal-dependent hydrolase
MAEAETADRTNDAASRQQAPMIVDAHAHIFPPLAGACGFATVEEHRRVLQLYVATHGEPVYRLRDNAIVPEAASILSSGELDSLDCLNDDAGFRAGRFGRFEWEFEGETYYRSFLPPSLQEMIAPPELLLQAMARAGVDVAVLQNASLYGRLNAEFAAAMQAHPGKLIGLADVRPAEADRPEEAERLFHAVRELGLRGVYYANRGLIASGYRNGFDDPVFDSYWEMVRSLGITVFWEILGTPLPTAANYLRELDRLDHWCRRFPDVPCVLTHGFAPDLLDGAIPDPVTRLLSRENLMIELLYPIHWGRLHDYPWPELRPIIERQIQLAGASRLVWGSDMPNVERNCTYRQSLEYLPRIMGGCLPSGDLDLILGGNMAGLFQV